jgi:2-polyprenyl-3-methyl-5-hydroxy-6-metoxy-1,4-benzoquinol methylase
MEKQEFQEKDIVGEGTLDVISKADRFNRWMYNTIKPNCHGNIMEIGSGVGNISKYFLDDGFSIMLTDIREGYCKRLKDAFAKQPNLLGTAVMNLTDEQFDTRFNAHINKYDTVFALNVIEHIFDDVKAIANCRKLLNENGHLVILVPSYQNLYNQFDKALGHYRRYNLKTLSELFKKNEFKIVHKQYFNFIGILGWFFSGKILKKESIPEGQMGLYNSLVPVFKIIDKMLFRSMGLSTIVVGKK